MSITRSITRPITRPLTRPLTSPGAGGGGVPIVNNGVLAPFVTFTRASTGTYFDSAGVMRTAAINEPRVDYDPDTLELRGLLVEEQRTNLILNSGAPANWLTVRSSIASASETAPDGGSTMGKLIASAVSGTHYARFALAATNGSAYTVSVFAKPAELSQLAISFLSDNGVFLDRVVIFDASSGVVVSNSGNLTIAIDDCGGGIYRFSATSVAMATASGAVGVGVASGGSPGFTGDGSSGILVWGAQLEAGSFATSYIPTEGTTVTRAIDDPDFTIPDGIVRLEYTYDDDTTANVAVTPGAAYQIPTGQKRIKHLRGYRS